MKKYFSSIGHLFKKFDTGGYKVDSVTLSQVFEQHQIDTQKSIMLKIDCEGGEQYILQDAYKELLVACRHIGVEIHYHIDWNTSSKFYKNFFDLPSWEHYNEWIKETFSKTHTITYHCANKKRGLGVYVMEHRSWPTQ